MKIISFAVILIFGLVVLMGCEEEEEKEKAAAGTTSVQAASGAMVSLEGTWQRCEFDPLAFDDYGFDMSYFYSDVFTGSNMNHNSWDYNNADCTGTAAAGPFPFSVTGIATVGSKTVTWWSDTTASATPPSGLADTVTATKVTYLYEGLTILDVIFVDDLSSPWVYYSSYYSDTDEDGSFFSSILDSEDARAKQ